jgi:O-antigen ligase
VDQIVRSKPTLGAYLVGAYLFSVPAFAYSESLGLLIIPQITGALLVAYAVLDILGSQSIKVPLEIQLYSFMGLWAATTFIFGANTSEWNALGTLIKVVAATFACAQLIKDETDFFTALKIFAFSILFVYYQNRYELRYLRITDQIGETDRFAGTLANANNAAIFSLTIIWASIVLLLYSRKGVISRALYFVPISISLLIIYYSGSKKGMIGMGLFALFITRLLYIRQRSSFYRRGLVLLISCFLIIGVSYFIYASPFFSRMEQLLHGGSGSDINRLNLAAKAIHVWLMDWKTFIMGVGYGNFGLVSDTQTYSHSTPFELLASNGIIGFSLFVGFFFFLFRKFVFLYRHIFNQELKSVYFACLIFLFIFSFFMMAAVLHDSRELMPILGTLAAFGQYQLRLRGQSHANKLPTSVL